MTHFKFMFFDILTFVCYETILIHRYFIISGISSITFRSRRGNVQKGGQKSTERLERVPFVTRRKTVISSQT